MNPPSYLYHKIHGGNTCPDEESVQWALEQILAKGLMPMVAREWCQLIPEQIRHLPIVWLTERSKNKWKGTWVLVTARDLKPMLLHSLNLEDVDWWVYQGTIPVSAIREI